MNNVDRYSFVLVSASACRTDYFVEWGLSILCMQRRSDLRPARVSSGRKENKSELPLTLAATPRNVTRRIEIYGMPTHRPFDRTS